MAITEKQLGQSRPANTTAASIYSPPSSTRVIIKSVEVTNTSSSKVKYRIFHDDNGTTYDETTALRWDITLGANESDSFNVYWTSNDSTGNFAVRTDTANALTFTFYGAELT